MQAISLIVAHRTDDMSKLPPVITTEVLKKPKQAAGRRQQVLQGPVGLDVVSTLGYSPFSFTAC